ncbi:MAG: hypothetical protein ACLPQ0_07580 [Candidatus Binatus sp.]|jgi:hypothetical protein
MVKRATHRFGGKMALMAASLVAGAMLALTPPVRLRDTDTL